MASREQTTTATLTGTVSDPSGLPIGGAKVTLTSSDIGVSRTFTSSETGRYTFPLLPAATYSLQVELAGFKSYRQAGIVLESGQNVTLNASLVIGDVTQTVEVTAETPVSEFGKRQYLVGCFRPADPGAPSQLRERHLAGDAEFLGSKQR